MSVDNPEELLDEPENPVEEFLDVYDDPLKGLLDDLEDPVDELVPGSSPFAREHSAPKSKIRPWMFIVAAAVVAAAIGIYLAMHFSALSEDYARAQAFYEAGQYEQASELYGSLGGYKDAADWHEKADLWVTARAAEADADENAEAWGKAADAYAAIGESEADEEAARCRSASSYYHAKDLMAAGQWAEANEALAPLVEQQYADAISLQAECAAHLTFDEAEAFFAEGRYYEAYLRYMSLSDVSYPGLPIMSDMAWSCIQDNPEAGVYYRNEAYPDDNCELTIDNYGYKNAYYKLYFDDELVRTIFIPGDETVTVSIPAGTYRINKAHGDSWFGPIDMFGDNGAYWTCAFDGSETYTFEPELSYTIDSGDEEGTGITNTQAGRNSI